VTQLPEPACRLGYTRQQVEEILGDRLDKFTHWMRGQTMAGCEGYRYNHDTKERETACGGESHGGIAYPWDLERFLAGLPVID
jgi:hypothetical protein